jgi:hypothetical protein
MMNLSHVFLLRNRKYNNMSNANNTNNMNATSYTKCDSFYELKNYSAFTHKYIEGDNCNTYLCKKIENIENTKLYKFMDKIFKCHMTNMPKKKGNEDCDCESICMAKISETQTIHDSSKEGKQGKQ